MEPRGGGWTDELDARPRAASPELLPRGGRRRGGALLGLLLLLVAPGCEEPGGNYDFRWEHRVGDGPWATRTWDTRVRGDYFLRATMMSVAGPVPAVHFWEGRQVVGATLDGVPLPRAFGSDSYFLLPAEHAGQTLEVHYRARAWTAYTTHPGEAGPLVQLWLPWARLELPGFAVGSLMVILGVGLLAVGVRRRASPLAWLGLFSAPLGLVLVGDSRHAELLAPFPELWRLTTGVAGCVFPAGLGLFVDSVFGDGPRRVLRRSAFACAGLVVLGLASDAAGLLPLGTVQLGAYGLLGVVFVQALRRVWPTARTGDRSARAFLVGMALGVVLGVPDIIAAVTGLFVVPIAPWGELLFVLAMGLAVEARFDEHRRRLGEASTELAARLEALEARNREVQGLNAELRRQVAERSRDLEKALGGTLTPAPGSTNLITGDLFGGRFRVVRLLGEGGMGAVYEVTRLSDGKPLALKVMTGQTDAHAARRFAREAEIAARIHHPRLVSVVDVGVTESGTIFLAMELVQGRSFEAERERFGQVEWALPLLADVAEGLAALHAEGVVHRDLKPANVLLETDASGVARARISDFGIARWSSAEGPDAFADTLPSASTPHGSHDSLTRSGMMMGTPVYMAPELARGAQRAQPSSDLFSFGVMAFEVLTGERPWAGPPIFLVLAGTPLEPPRRPLHVPPRVAALVLASLSSEPSLRPTAAEVAQTLRASG